MGGNKEKKYHSEATGEDRSPMSYNKVNKACLNCGYASGNASNAKGANLNIFIVNSFQKKKKLCHNKNRVRNISKWDFRACAFA
jgi:hypothetical protein